jgi:hypothetical protein
MKKIIFIIIFIIIIISLVTIVGLLRKRTELKSTQQKPGTVEVEEKPIPSPLPITTERQFPQTTLPSEQTPTATTKSYQLLFAQPFLYLGLDYPLLYVYDPKEGIIKYLNLEDETYKEIFKDFNLKNAFLSEDKTKIVIIENTNKLNLLDIQKDELITLPPVTNKIIFIPEIILYINDNKKASYLAYFKDGKLTKIRNLGILNPEFAFLKNGLLIYEENSPVFFLDLKKPSQLSIFLPAKENYDLLVNKNKDLILVIFKENYNWQSQVIDLNTKVKYSFPWGTVIEKCSFDDLLICAIPTNFNPENWRMLESSFDEKIIIYNPKNSEVKEINLEEKFDIVKPKLTPMGIIFWNRLDSKFYLLKVD